MTSNRYQRLGRLAIAAASLAYSACASIPAASTGATRNLAVRKGAIEAMVRHHGSGPAVVFETGAGSPLSVWRQVLPRVSEETTVFAYNRSGYGRSRVFGSLDDPRRIAETLRQGLRASGVEPPYVLVGHSLGGLYVNLFARLYPDEVAGVVLVDSSHPDQFAQLEERKPLANAMFKTSYALGPPERRYELENARRISRVLAEAGDFPAVPLTVLTAGQGPFWSDADDERWWLGLQRELVEMSPRGMARVVPDSGHFIQREAPEAVVEAILEMLSLDSATGPIARRSPRGPSVEGLEARD